MTIEQKAAVDRFIVEKVTPKGWRLDSPAPYRLDDNGNLIVTLLDRHRHKHWLNVTPNGEITFRPTAMTCI